MSFIIQVNRSLSFFRCKFPHFSHKVLSGTSAEFHFGLQRTENGPVSCSSSSSFLKELETASERVASPLRCNDDTHLNANTGTTGPRRTVGGALQRLGQTGQKKKKEKEQKEWCCCRDSLEIPLGDAQIIFRRVKTLRCAICLRLPSLQ